MQNDDTLYTDIDELIRETDDTKDRAMILIMQRILMSVERSLADEVALQTKVLNGLLPFHKGDHELIFELRENKVVDAIKWLNEFRRPSDVHAVCDYSRAKMQEELDSRKQFRRKMDNALFEISKALLYLVGGAAFYGFTTGYPVVQKTLGG